MTEMHYIAIAIALGAALALVWQLTRIIRDWPDEGDMQE